MSGRLSFLARPGEGTLQGCDGPIGDFGGRDGVLYVPDTAVVGAPVMVFLHGATGTGRRELRAVVASADRFGTVIVAPDSRGMTWDIIGGGFGPDVTVIDQALALVAGRCNVDFHRMAIGGISDGASYALSLGVNNGDLFSAIVAFSPGGMVPDQPHGWPRIFVSHGTADPILPIDGCSRRLVPMLQQVGYEVTYREFDGGHTVPPVVADEAFAWWVGAASD